jgi:hypothetical protein
MGAADDKKSESKKNILIENRKPISGSHSETVSPSYRFYSPGDTSQTNSLQPMENILLSILLFTLF